MKLFSRNIFFILLVLVIVLYAVLLLLSKPVLTQDDVVLNNSVAESSPPQSPSQDAGITYSYCDELYPQGAPELCTMEYLPVCANDGKTYGNGCMACGANVVFFVDGEC